MTAQLCIYPMEVAKTRLAVGNYNGIIDCLLKVYRLEGGMALFRGLAPSLAGGKKKIYLTENLKL